MKYNFIACTGESLGAIKAAVLVTPLLVADDCRLCTTATAKWTNIATKANPAAQADVC